MFSCQADEDNVVEIQSSPGNLENCDTKESYDKQAPETNRDDLEEAASKQYCSLVLSVSVPSKMVAFSLDGFGGAILSWVEGGAVTENTEIAIALPAEEVIVNIVNEVVDGQRRIELHTG